MRSLNASTLIAYIYFFAQKRTRALKKLECKTVPPSKESFQRALEKGGGVSCGCDGEDGMNCVCECVNVNAILRDGRISVPRVINQIMHALRLSFL